MQRVTARRAYTGAFLPFLVILFLCGERVSSQGEEYLPPTPSRSVTIQLVKSLKPIHGGKAGELNRDFAVDGYALGDAARQYLVLEEPPLHRLHFSFLTNRLVRSPPHKPI